MNLKVKALSPKIGKEIPAPFYASAGAAAMDLHACVDEPVTIPAGGRAVIPTGIAIALPSAQYVALVFARSGLGIKHGVAPANCVGVIDSDYRGEIMVGLQNSGESDYTIQPADRIAQLMITPVVQAQVELVDELDDTDRGAGGFGSTGRYERGADMAIILASQSPRRRQLLEQMGFTDFLIRPAQGEELADPNLDPGGLVEALSRQKALEISASADPEDLVIAADTVVAVDGQVLGKPHSTQHAHQMLSALSGREHTVYTGVTVCRGGQILTQHEATTVRFRPLTTQEIDAYIATGEPMDKAGSYGIQGRGALLVEGISGDYFNVVGLPVCRLGRMLTQFGVDPLTGM